LRHALHCPHLAKPSQAWLEQFRAFFQYLFLQYLRARRRGCSRSGLGSPAATA
jgi:hypothetical protein